jgi:molecular chaperone Hsp33
MVELIMIKKQRYGKTLKEQHLASAKDRVYSFLLADGAFRGAILHATRMVNEMRANHELGILETLVLGHAYIGAGLMSVNLKGNDKLSFQVDCTGPIKGLLAETNAFGEVRGYLKNLPIPLEKPLKDFNLSPFYGAGMLTVTKYLEDAKHPFTGQVHLHYGSPAKDLAHYFLISEQIPTAFHLSVQFNPDGEVVGAGGFFIQVMPEANTDTVAEVEALVSELPSLGKSFAEKIDPGRLLQETFKSYNPKILDEGRVEFMCHCSKDGVRNLLRMLPVHDLKDIRDNGPFPVELKCHYCNTAYYFSKDDIGKLYNVRYPNN